MEQVIEKIQDKKTTNESSVIYLNESIIDDINSSFSYEAFSDGVDIDVQWENNDEWSFVNTDFESFVNTDFESFVGELNLDDCYIQHEDITILKNEDNSTSKPILYTKGLDELYQDWSFTVTELIKNDVFTSCEKMQVEDYIQGTLTTIRNSAGWLTKYYYDNVNCKYLIEGLLHAISHLNYELLKPFGQVIAGDCMGSKDLEIVEYAIKAFENWNQKDSIMYLEEKKIHTPWLQNYLNDVIEYIKEG